MEHTLHPPKVESTHLLGEPGCRAAEIYRDGTDAMLSMDVREHEVVMLVLGPPVTDEQKILMAEQEARFLDRISSRIDTYGESLADLNERYDSYSDERAVLVLRGQADEANRLQEQYSGVQPVKLPHLDSSLLVARVIQKLSPEVYPLALVEAQTTLLEVAAEAERKGNVSESERVMQRLAFVDQEIRRLGLNPHTEQIEPAPVQQNAVEYSTEPVTEEINTYEFINSVDSKDIMIGHEVLHTGKQFIVKIGNVALHYLVKKPIEKLKTAA